MHDDYICYRHNWRANIPCPEDHAYEGGTEYLQAQISQLQAVVNDLREGVIDLFNILTRSEPEKAPETENPTSDPQDGFEGLRKLAREERVQNLPDWEVVEKKIRKDLGK